MLKLVSTAERPDLVTTTGRWRWQAFFKDEMSLKQVLQLEEDCARNGQLMPTVLVLLDAHQPVGMIALCLDDLPDRPDLNPWLAGVYVDHAFRGKGYAAYLIQGLEDFAVRAGIKQLSLYTSEAAGLYRKAGWVEIETFTQDGQKYTIMRKELSPH